MIHSRVVRSIGWALLACIGVAVASQGAFAGQRHHTVSPSLAIGPKATQVAGAKTPLFTFTCNTVGGTPEAITCYDPDQIRHAYGIDSLINAGYDGTGSTIVIVDAFQSPTLGDDLAVFNLLFGLPDAALDIVAPDGLTDFDPNDDNMQGWAGEITLDVEWSHAIAPGARIVLVLAKSNDDADILSAVKYAIDHRLGDIVSMSFGENESCVDPDLLSQYHDVFASATQKNMTLFASSGDQGAAQVGLPTCDGSSWDKAVSHPASDPLVTAVGGTELHATRYCVDAIDDPSFPCDPVPGTYQGEIAWNELTPLLGPDSIATGGGFSVLFDAPPYQKSAIKGNQRGVPDVAYNAAVLHGVLVPFQFFLPDGGVFLFGGTSAGSPQWAGIAAIAAQKAGHPLGFLNKAVYQIAKVNKKYPLSLHDVTIGNNSVLLHDSNNNPVNITGFPAGADWDATTGWGTPIATSLVDYLIQYVSPGDGQSAISTTKPKNHPKPIVPGHVDPH